MKISDQFPPKQYTNPKHKAFAELAASFPSQGMLFDFMGAPAVIISTWDFEEFRDLCGCPVGREFGPLIPTRLKKIFEITKLDFLVFPY